MKILVIDDEKPTLAMFKLFLTAYGYDVHTAENGEQGLTIFKEILPEIVFTDLKMPGIDGIEVLRQIRQLNPKSQVIIITGHGNMGKALETLDLGASDFINKPVERKALDSALERAEKRTLQPNDKEFELSHVKSGNHIDIHLKGKLSGDRKKIFISTWQPYSLGQIIRINFWFDDLFSFDRKGITFFMEVLGQIKQQEIKIYMKGLSYNYMRFFQMVGMEKIAVLETDSTEGSGS